MFVLLESKMELAIDLGERGHPSYSNGHLCDTAVIEKGFPGKPCQGKLLSGRMVRRTQTHSCQDLSFLLPEPCGATLPGDLTSSVASGGSWSQSPSTFQLWLCRPSCVSLSNAFRTSICSIKNRISRKLFSKVWLSFL